MSVLKQGAKGKTVEKLQKDLNKLGSKPKLKVDGIFGPITKSSVQHFQKKANQKADGTVGAHTAAAILMGGPLPEMTARDGREMKTLAAAQRKVNATYVSLMDSVMADGINLRKTVEGHRDLGKKAMDSNKILWTELNSIIDDLNKKQAQFESLLLIAPKTAAKLVPICEDLEAHAHRLADAIMTSYADISKDVDVVVKEVTDKAKTISDHAKKLNKLGKNPLKP